MTAKRTGSLRFSRSLILLVGIAGLNASAAASDDRVRIHYSLSDACVIEVRRIEPAEAAGKPLLQAIARHLGPRRGSDGRRLIAWPTDTGYTHIACELDPSGQLLKAQLIAVSRLPLPPRTIGVRLSTLGSKTFELARAR